MFIRLFHRHPTTAAALSNTSSVHQLWLRSDLKCVIVLMTDEHLHDIDSLNSFPYIKSDCTPTVVPVPPINGNSPTVCEYLEIGVLPSAPNEPSKTLTVGPLPHYETIPDDVTANSQMAPTEEPPLGGYHQTVEPNAEATIFTNQLQELHDKIEKWNDADPATSEFLAPAPIREPNAMPSHVFGEEFAAAVSVGDSIFDDEPVDERLVDDVPTGEQMQNTDTIDTTKQLVEQAISASEDGTVCNTTEGPVAPLMSADTNDTAPSIGGDVIIGQDLPTETGPAVDAKTAVRPPQAINRTRPRKKRRRIVLLNDDSDSSSAGEHNRDELMDPSESSSEDEAATVDAATDTATAESRDRAAKERTPSPTLERLEEIVHNEKPGPKSKKASTQMIKEFQARALLKAAVVIPLTSGDNKRRKKRIIDDSDEEPSCDISMSVEDIGMPDTVDEDGEPFEDIGGGASILLNEIEPFDDDDAMEGVEIDKIGEVVVPIEMPVATGADDTDEVDEHEEQNDESAASNKDDDDDGEADDDNDADDDNAADDGEIKELEDGDSEENRERFNSDPIVIKPISQLLDPNRLATNEATAVDPIDILTPDTILEPELDVSIDAGISTNSIPVAKKTVVAMPQRKPQPPAPKSKKVSSVSFAISSESSEEEHIPNELYFGTPDLTQLFNQARNRAANRARGGRPAPANVRPITIIPKQNVARRGTNMARRGRPAVSVQHSRRSPSSSDSDSPDTTRRKPGPKSMPPNRPQYVQHIRAVPPAKKKKKKRSKDIPNEIYFGEVQVPLHVLHSYGADSHESASSSSSDSESEEEDPVYVRQQHPYISMPRGRGRGITVTHISPPKSSRPQSRYVCTNCAVIRFHKFFAFFFAPSSRGRPGRPPHTPSRSGSSSVGHRESPLSTMKKYLKAAGLKRVNFKQLWESKWFIVLHMNTIH